MARLKWLAITITAIALLAGAGTVLAQEEKVPAPYAGMKNPLPWDDASAQAAGKRIYASQCLGCHGVKGEGLSQADFSLPDSRKNLEAQADFFFWILSDGRLQNGMPGYKASLSEQERWQVLTYIWSLGGGQPAAVVAPVAAFDGTLQLNAPQEGKAGEKLLITATVLDRQGNPVVNAPVKFFLRVDFFASGLMEIAEADTNPKGIALLEYVPRTSGEVSLVARFEGAEAESPLTLAEADGPLYTPDVGIELPKLGPEVFVGPESALRLDAQERAPTSGLRLPGGVVSWLFLPAAAIALIWWSYFKVVYQLWRIPPAGNIGGTDVRIVPRVALVFVVGVGAMLVLMLLTGPYSHFHLHP